MHQRNAAERAVINFEDHLGCRALFFSWVVCWEYCWHHSGRPPIYSYYLCLIVLEIVQWGHNKCFQLDQISGGVLYLCYPLPWWIKVLYFPLLLPLVVISTGPGALLMWYLILGDTLKLDSLWVLSMFRRIHPWLHEAGCVWLGSRGSDGKKLLSLAGMLGNMLWGAMEPLLYCGCISVAPECLLVCFFGLDDEEGIPIIHLLGPDILQWWYPCFYSLQLCACQR